MTAPHRYEVERRRSQVTDTTVAALREFAETWRSLMGEGEPVSRVDHVYVHGPHSDLPSGSTARPGPATGRSAPRARLRARGRLGVE